MNKRDFTNDEILAWINVLEDYAHDWDNAFENKPSYYTQEFWYLFISCWANSRKGTPLTMSQATQVMKSGSNRTREERIRKAVVDGYLIKQKHQTDGRETIVMPTEKLADIINQHLKRTLNGILHTLEKLP